MPPVVQQFSFLEAAIQVLRAQQRVGPMHYVDITQQASNPGLVRTSERSPAATLRADQSGQQTTACTRRDSALHHAWSRPHWPRGVGGANHNATSPTPAGPPPVASREGRRLSFLDAADQILASVGQPVREATR